MPAAATVADCKPSIQGTANSRRDAPHRLCPSRRPCWCWQQAPWAWASVGVDPAA